MRVLGDGRAQRLEHPHLLRRVGDVVLAAHDVGDAGVEVVDGHREVVDRGAIRPGDDGVVLVGIGEGDLAAHDVAHHGLSGVGDPQADGA